MRIRNAVILILVSLGSAITISVTGQEEALPVVRAKDAATDPTAQSAESFASLRLEPTVYLAVEPIRELAPITLEEAARNNDWITFQDLYVKAQNRGEDVSRFQSLYELWSWSLSDPIGAFYGRDIYDRLARAYPGFAQYINEFVLVDRRGNTFYPTAETRAFLLERATRGEVPRVMIAEAAEEPQRALPKVRAKAFPTKVAAAPSVKAAPAPAAAPTSDPITIDATPDPVVTAQPIVAAPQPAVVTPSPAPIPAPARTAVAEAPAQTPQPIPAATTESNELRNRGILLLIIGLLGVGILAVILRAPKEEPRPLVDISHKVHPIHKQGTPPDEHRATGSHG